jgi:hypothetical protein
MFFKTDAPAGASLYGCNGANSWAVEGGLSAVTVMSDGSPVGSSGTLDFFTGLGLMTVISATGTQIDLQTALDTAVVQTQPGEQGGAALLCASASGSGSAYTCSLNPTLGSYTEGMILHWIPDLGASGGNTTLNVDTLGPQPVKLPDGVGNPAATDILAGRLYTIWYDGAAFRLPAAAATGGSGGGGGGGSVNVNGSSVSSPNFNASTPAAASGYNNATLQVTGSNVSIQVPLSVDAPGWQICNPAGCGSETSNGYYAIVNPNGVTFDECGVNLAIAATGSAVHVDVQDSTGTSVFSAGYISIGTGVTSEVFNSSFVGGTYTAVKGAKFRAAVKQNDSGGTAQFAYVRCRVH